MGSKTNPFSEAALTKIFRPNPDMPDRLITRESNTIEFKANFHLGRELDRYGKTIAAFANNIGGYIIFGVTDKPRRIVGMTNTRFVDLEPHTLTEYLNNKFSPEISWDTHIHYIGSREFGIIFVHESSEKPVIAKSNGSDVFQEGDIFYRYRGRSERIKYSELKQIINRQEKKVHDIWFNHINRIARIGVENAAIFDPENGTVTGKAGQFVIDKSLLPKLRFIKEGEFKEITGAPALKIVGDVQVLSAGEVSVERTEIKTKVLHSSDIIEAFLRQQKVTNSKDYIIEICHSTTAYLPIYYFIKMAKIGIDETIKEIKCAEHCNVSVKSRLIFRLSKDDPRIHYNIPNTHTPQTQKKQSVRKDLLSKKFKKNIELEELRHILYIIQSLKKDEVDIDYTFPLLLYWYENFWDKIKMISQTEFRKALCHLDYILYRDKVL